MFPNGHNVFSSLRIRCKESVYDFWAYYYVSQYKTQALVIEL